MTLTAVWEEMESSAPKDRAGRIVRRIHPESHLDIHAALELHPRDHQTRRTVELTVPSVVLENVDPPVSTRHVEASFESREGDRTALVLALEDPAIRDLFGSMCADVAGVTAMSSTDGEAASAWLGRFAKWRRMLEGGGRGLSQRRQQGLFGELLTIRDRLVPAVGLDEAVGAWRGPDGAPRDFELRAMAVEVKTSGANEPQVVPIHGERQLDDSGLDGLVLLHFSLEVLRDAGESLPALVASLRELAAGLPAEGLLEDRLLQSGYLDEHVYMYRRTGYQVRRVSHFRVQEGFPRIVEGDLADGVGDVAYRLAIDVCRDFEVESYELDELLRGRE